MNQSIDADDSGFNVENNILPLQINISGLFIFSHHSYSFVPNKFHKHVCVPVYIYIFV